jgi:hypothetical protein
MRISKAFGVLLALAGAPSLLTSSCQPSFPTQVSAQALSVQITAGDVGSLDNRLPLDFTMPSVYTVTVTAEEPPGVINTKFNGYVRFSVEPGTVVSVTAPANEAPEGRNVLLVNGVATDVQVSITGAYGNAQIWVEDLGYEPINPLGAELADGGVDLPQSTCRSAPTASTTTTTAWSTTRSTPAATPRTTTPRTAGATPAPRPTLSTSRTPPSPR